jgi:hypothetical protein
MKVQYFGDENDYRKFALLRLLANEGGFKIGEHVGGQIRPERKMWQLHNMRSGIIGLFLWEAVNHAPTPMPFTGPGPNTSSGIALSALAHIDLAVPIL